MKKLIFILFLVFGCEEPNPVIQTPADQTPQMQFCHLEPETHTEVRIDWETGLPKTRTRTRYVRVCHDAIYHKAFPNKVYVVSMQRNR